MTKQDKAFNEEGLVIRINKEEEKRLRDEIRDFVKELLKLPNTKYVNLPIDTQLSKALEEAKRLTNNAYQRHLSFLVRLVFEQDYEAIKEEYERVHHPYRNDPGKIREVENYRDKLIAGDKDVINDLLAKFAEVDIQYLRQTARNASKEIITETKRQEEKAAQMGMAFTGQMKPTKSSKLLYQYLFKLDLL